MFKAECRAKTIDPDTSHEVARKISGTTKVKSQMRVALRLVKNFPGLTALELRAKVATWEPELFESWGGQLTGNPIGRALSMLKKKAFVTQGERRRCLVGGNKSVTWYLTKGVKLCKNEK